MKLALFYILMVMPVVPMSQTLTEDSRVKVNPTRGEEVILYSAHDCDHCYYYLPSSLRISMKNGTPQSSFVVWKKENTSKAIGGTLHFLVEWGLKPGYENDLQKMIRAVCDSMGVIMGPVVVNAHESTAVIDGNDKLSHILTSCLTHTPSLPSTPGAKMALSFRFTEKEIEDFVYFVNHPEKVTTNLRLTYTYAVTTSSGQVRSNKTTLRLPFRHIFSTIK